MIITFQIAEKSALQGYPESRLPTFTEDDSALILGSADFLGINYYTGQYARPVETNIDDVDYYSDMDATTVADPTWYG